MNPFVAQILLQLEFLHDENYSYSELHVYVGGVPDAWVFGPDHEFEFPPGSGLLIVREDPETWGSAGVPEHVFRLDAIVATQLV